MGGFTQHKEISRSRNFIKVILQQDLNSWFWSRVDEE